MAKSSFSFHCMICFEEFDPEARYPVVLPCGHTYVCCICSERLDKCMECRTPLFWKIPQPEGNSRSNAFSVHRNVTSSTARSSWSSSARARAGTGRVMQRAESYSPPAPTARRRLPLPKNVVLLSLIEATELATEDANKNNVSSPSMGSMDDACFANISTSPSYPLTEEEAEQQKIKLGTSVAVGVAGTYAVAAREGLPIFTSRPGTPPRRKGPDEQDSLADIQQNAEEDLDKLVNFFHLDSKVTEEVKENRFKEPPPAHLSCGDRVQIVSLHAGWAKLARGYGYVRADGNKLVKVGGSVDRACKLEAMIRTISVQRKQLRIEQSKVDNLFIRLMNDLQISLMNDEDLTVIVADTFSPANTYEAKPCFEAEGRQESSIERQRSSNRSSIYPDKSASIFPEKPYPLNRNQKLDQNAGYVCFANDVFGVISGGDDLERNSDSQNPTTTPIAHALGGAVDDMLRNAPDVNATLFPSRSHPSPSAMRAGARAWRELHGRAPSRGIDFKTGLSGHMALLSSHAHPHEYLDTHRLSSSTSFRGMSNHTGLTMTKSTLASLFNVLGLPALPMMPVLGTPPRNDDPTSPTCPNDSI